MSTRICAVLILALMIAAPSLTLAAPEPSDPKKQTPWHLYLTAKEAFDLKKAKGDKVFFVDVRDPVEIMFTGFTDIVDVNVPFLQANRNKWNSKKSVLLMERNPDFAPGIARTLKAKGLDTDTPIILMCRSGGTRGAPSAKALVNQGYKAVYVVVDGFEGGALKEGPQKNWRLKDGWKNSGLPWSYKLNKNKIYQAQN